VRENYTRENKGVLARSRASHGYLLRESEIYNITLVIVENKDRILRELLFTPFFFVL
jgi:hypothetical protein